MSPDSQERAPQNPIFASVEEAVEEIRAGRMVVVVDDEDRENEGDLTLAAEFVTPEAIKSVTPAFYQRINSMFEKNVGQDLPWKTPAQVGDARYRCGRWNRVQSD